MNVGFDEKSISNIHAYKLNQMELFYRCNTIDKNIAKTMVV